MGAGPCSEEAKVQLLRKVVNLNLGFSEAQLSLAIDNLVKEIGSWEQALAWIPQDNFTLLVNYILDNFAGSECGQVNSPSKCEGMRKMGNQPMLSAQGGRARSEERRKGEDHPTKSGVKRLINGCQVGMSVENFPSEADKSGSKIEQQNKKSPSRGSVDRNDLRKHYMKKLCTDIAKVPDHSTGFKVLTTQSDHTNPANSSGHVMSRKKARSPEHMIPNAVHMKKTNFVVELEDPKAKKKRESVSGGLMKETSSFSKNGIVMEPKVKKMPACEARTVTPKGSCDPVASPGSLLVEKNKIFGQNRSPKGGHTDRSRVESVAQQSGKKKASQVSGDLNEAGEILSTLKGLKSVDRGDKMRGVEPSRAVHLSDNDRQKATCSVSNEIPVKEEQDCSFNGADTFFISQREAFVKESNNQKPLEAMKALKQKQKQVSSVESWRIEGNHLEGRGHEVVKDIPGKKRGYAVSSDISRGFETIPITCVNEYNTDVLPENFQYVTRSAIRQAAHVDTSISRIGDLHCCCSDDCLRSSEACKCTDSTRGEYAYDENGRLIERLAVSFQSGSTTTNGDFVTECCDKCRCSLKCGNRIVQRGITRKLQVFMTPTKKGWGVRALERIPARSFVFEYIGEIATSLEQFERNAEYEKSGIHSYTMELDADLDMEKSHFKDGLNDNEALVLDATIYGNVSRFVNHRCNDANLFLRPVQIETRDTHYYHAALFAAQDIQEMEELTWDYNIDFQDKTHSVKAFKCDCKSSFCRDNNSAFNRDMQKSVKSLKSTYSKQQRAEHGRR